MPSLLIKSISFFVLMTGCSEPISKSEAYEEPYWETRNPARIFDWNTLEILYSNQVDEANIDAQTPEDLIAQLEAIFDMVNEAENIQFAFKRELWEHTYSDGTIGEVTVDVELKLQNCPLLVVIRYVAELNRMTFSVKEDQIVFRPLIG
ncbi:MAG: hypothetical protein AAGH89_15510 [Verrucomicrobiota bacterium]